MFRVGQLQSRRAAHSRRGVSSAHSSRRAHRGERHRRKPRTFRRLGRAACRVPVRSLNLHANSASAEREQAIRALGADIVRTPGNYDDAARACAEDARRMGWGGRLRHRPAEGERT